MGKWKIKTHDVKRILEKVKKEKAEFFDENYIEELYREYMSVPCDDTGNIERLRKELEIFDTEGARIGYINTDGTVRDGESNVMGYISISDGKVSDSEKKTIGFARGVRVDWIACYYFFHFFEK